MAANRLGIAKDWFYLFGFLTVAVLFVGLGFIFFGPAHLIPMLLVPKLASAWPAFAHAIATIPTLVASLIEAAVWGILISAVVTVISVPLKLYERLADWWNQEEKSMPPNNFKLERTPELDAPIDLGAPDTKHTRSPEPNHAPSSQEDADSVQLDDKERASLPLTSPTVDKLDKQERLIAANEDILCKNEAGIGKLERDYSRIRGTVNKLSAEVATLSADMNMDARLTQLEMRIQAVTQGFTKIDSELTSHRRSSSLTDLASSGTEPQPAPYAGRDASATTPSIEKKFGVVRLRNGLAFVATMPDQQTLADLAKPIELEQRADKEEEVAAPEQAEETSETVVKAIVDDLIERAAQQEQVLRTKSEGKQDVPDGGIDVDDEAPAHHDSPLDDGPDRALLAAQEQHKLFQENFGALFELVMGIDIDSNSSEFSIVTAETIRLVKEALPNIAFMKLLELQEEDGTPTQDMCYQMLIALNAEQALVADFKYLLQLPSKLYECVLKDAAFADYFAAGEFEEAQADEAQVASLFSQFQACTTASIAHLLEMLSLLVDSHDQTYKATAEEIRTKLSSEFFAPVLEGMTGDALARDEKFQFTESKSARHSDEGLTCGGFKTIEDQQEHTQQLAFKRLSEFLAKQEAYCQRMQELKAALESPEFASCFQSTAGNWLKFMFKGEALANCQQFIQDKILPHIEFFALNPLPVASTQIKKEVTFRIRLIALNESIQDLSHMASNYTFYILRLSRLNTIIQTFVIPSLPKTPAGNKVRSILQQAIHEPFQYLCRYELLIRDLEKDYQAHHGTLTRTSNEANTAAGVLRLIGQIKVKFAQLTNWVNEAQRMEEAGADLEAIAASPMKGDA